MTFDFDHSLHLHQTGARKVTYHSFFSPLDLWKHLGPIPDSAAGAGGDCEHSHGEDLCAREAKTGEWCRDKLVLYGVNELKTPAAARKALTRAVVEAGDRGLVVPPSTVEIERTLREA